MYAGQAQSQVAGAIIGGGHTKATADQVRQSEVSEEISHLSRAVDLIGMTVNQISDRLVPVRRQTGNATTGKNDPQPPESVLCGVADAIRAQRRQLEMFQAVLQSAQNELEI